MATTSLRVECMDLPADAGATAVSRERNRTPGSRLLLILPVLTAASYPALLIGLYAIGRWVSARPSTVSYLVMGVGLIAVFAVPLHGFVAAYRIARLEAPTTGEQFMRVLCHVVAATPPLFGAFGMAAVMLGSSYGDYVAWLVVWLGIAAYAYDRTADSRPFVPRIIARPVLRVSHGISAATLILVFVAVHLGNHLTALWSLQTHSLILKTLQVWYRNALVQPLIVALLLFQVVSGLTLLSGKLSERSDIYRVIQSVTGAYLAVYIPAHLFSIFVLGRWFYGIDTGTSYVFLENGYFPNLFDIRFITHYWLAAFAIITHCGCGLRNILLTHKVGEVISNRTFIAVAVTGVVVGTVIALALCGVHLAPAR